MLKKNDPYLVKETGKGDQTKFDLQLLCSEGKQKSTAALLVLDDLGSKLKHERINDFSWFPKIAVAGSVPLKQRIKKIDALSSQLIAPAYLKARANFENFQNHPYLL